MVKRTGRKVKTKEEILVILKKKLDEVVVIAQLDTPKTFACYRVILDPCCVIWVDARSGEIVYARPVPNRLKKKGGIICPRI